MHDELIAKAFSAYAAEENIDFSSGARGVVVFRLEAGNNFGLGHSARCFVLACRLLEENFSVVLLTRQSDRSFLSCWLDLSLRSRNLHVVIGENESVGSASDVAFTLSHIGFFDAVWLVVDCYAFSDIALRELQEGLRQSSGCLMVFEDFEDYGKPADLILNQNACQLAGLYRLADGKVVLSGLEFFLCPGWVVSARRSDAIRRYEAKTTDRLLITLGGADIENRGLSVALKLARYLPESTQIVYACTSDAKGFELAINEVKPWQDRIEVLYRPRLSDVAPFCSRAICAGGVTALELLAIGIPIAVLVLSENQRKGARVLAQSGWCEVYEELADLVRTFKLKFSIRHKDDIRVPSNQNPIDLLGPQRVVSAMISVQEEKWQK